LQTPESRVYVLSRRQYALNIFKDFTVERCQFDSNQVRVKNKICCSNNLDMPTVEQLKTLFILSFWATKIYLPVFLVRIDERTKNIVILAGEENKIIIYLDEKWRYL
jgi:hypothetical protein